MKKCANCSKRAQPDRKLCVSCAARYSRWAAKRRADQKAAGGCSFLCCRAPAPPGRRRCAAHRDSEYAVVKRMRARHGARAAPDPDPLNDYDAEL